MVCVWSSWAVRQASQQDPDSRYIWPEWQPPKPSTNAHHIMMAPWHGKAVRITYPPATPLVTSGLPSLKASKAECRCLSFLDWICCYRNIWVVDDLRLRWVYVMPLSWFILAQLFSHKVSTSSRLCNEVSALHGPLLPFDYSQWLVHCDNYIHTWLINIHVCCSLLVFRTNQCHYDIAKYISAAIFSLWIVIVSGVCH